MNRWIIYGIGMITLALGLTLNTKSNLGVSPIISIAYLFSEITKISFGDVTLLYYCIFVVCEFLLDHNWKDFLQVPFSIVFTRFLNLFSSMFPFQCQTLPSQIEIAPTNGINTLISALPISTSACTCRHLLIHFGRNW